MMITKQKKERANFFLRKRTLVHIKTKKDFYNGYIVEVHSDKIIFDDRLFGEIIVFFEEIFRIEPYKDREVRP